MADGHEGWLVVERFAKTIRPPSIPLSNEQVRHKYRGYDGIQWPEIERIEFALQRGLASERDYPSVRSYYKTLSMSGEKKRQFDLIYCIRHSEANRGNEKLSFLGFDYGYFESEYNHYSYILQEIVYGLHQSLTLLHNLLNDSLLFRSLDAVDAFRKARTALASRTRLEDDRDGDPIQVIALYELSIEGEGAFSVWRPSKS